MLTEAAGSQRLLRNINRMALVRHLCGHPGLSRAELADAVGLTKSTVSLLVRDLIEEGWLAERDVVATGGLGRRPTPLFIDPSRLALMGAELGVESARVVATSLTGEVLGCAVVRCGKVGSPKARINSLGAAMLKLRRELPAGHRFIGIGVGLPGGVDEACGDLLFAPNLGWRDVPFGAMLRARLMRTSLDGLPLFVQNEADVAALGELEFNPAQAARPLLYLSLNRGVGAGLVVGDRLLTGSRGFAGEVGHVVLDIDGPRCTCGRRGCAEALIGPRAMLPPEEAGASALEIIHRRLADGDAAMQRAVNQAGSYLGTLLQNLASAYDPTCIVLGGALVALGDDFLAPAMSTLARYATAAGLAPPAVRTSRHGADAVAIGAAALARYRLTRPLIAAREGDGTRPERHGRATTPDPGRHARGRRRAGGLALAR